MSIAGTYQNISGVVVDRRRRPLARRRRLTEREAWVIEAGDIIRNVGITILIDSRYSGPASATPQLGTQNICIVSGPLPNSPVLTATRDDQLVSVDLVIVVEDGDYVVKELAIRPRAGRAVLGGKGGSKKDGGKQDDPKAQHVAEAGAKDESKKEATKKADRKKKDKPKGRKDRGSSAAS